MFLSHCPKLLFLLKRMDTHELTNGALIETEVGVEQIHSRLHEVTEQMIDNPVLDAIEAGTLTQDEWREFAKQRYLAARHFEALLKAGIQKAKEAGDEELVEALSSNLRDEEGFDKTGNPLPTGSHEKWRQDFYNALGLDGHALSSAAAFDGTMQYDGTLRELIEAGDILTVSGALLLQEYSIPEEFKRIRIGRDLTFPDQFVLQPTDPSEMRRQKGFARLYIDHHIAHDATSHYPELERAIIKHARNPDALAKIFEGMNIISAAKRKFYESLQERLRQK